MPLLEVQEVPVLRRNPRQTQQGDRGQCRANHSQEISLDVQSSDMGTRLGLIGGQFNYWDQ